MNWGKRDKCNMCNMPKPGMAGSHNSSQKLNLVSKAALKVSFIKLTNSPALLVGAVDVRREGTAGGFKELDETEVEEARKRRKEFEEKVRERGVSMEF